jgi:hypothetical protein
LVTASEETMLALRWTLQNPGARNWWEEYKSFFTEPMQKFVHELTGE